MKKFLCAVLLVVSVLSEAAWAQTRLDVRLAEDQAGSGLVEASVAHSDRKVYLHEASVITNADVAEAHVVAGSGATFNVVMHLTSDGATRIANATRSHVGRPVAILVNGAVIAAPTVRDPIGQDAVINGTFTRAEATAIANGLTGK
jgi:preprotein translocase subunit SecD